MWHIPMHLLEYFRIIKTITHDEIIKTPVNRYAFAVDSFATTFIFMNHLKLYNVNKYIKSPSHTARLSLFWVWSLEIKKSLRWNPSFSDIFHKLSAFYRIVLLYDQGVATPWYDTIDYFDLGTRSSCGVRCKVK